ncbi:MAG: hypothetical protein KDB79_07110 [Acidobacteria bacterium]|nr:hypothetical protein [Acidobacteriota bacterium]
MKNIILWNYPRGTWQYDLFCLLIIAFIFLTPKTWFNTGEKVATRRASVAVKAQDFSHTDNLEKDQNAIAQFKTPKIQRPISPQ